MWVQPKRRCTDGACQLTACDKFFVQGREGKIREKFPSTREDGEVREMRGCKALTARRIRLQRAAMESEHYCQAFAVWRITLAPGKE